MTTEYGNKNIKNDGSLVLKPWTIRAQQECEAPYLWPIDENEDVMADQYNLTRTYLHGGLDKTLQVTRR